MSQSATEGGAVRIASVGHAVFAASMIAVGIIGLVKGDFTAIWDGVPTALPARNILAYVCAVISLACGCGLFWRRTSASAARVLLAFLALWLLMVKGRYIVLAPLVEGSYQSAAETAVLVSAAWVLYTWFAAEWDRRHLGFATAENGVRIARVLYGLALIAFGLSHFAYLNLTAPLVPSWLPWHVGWAYFTGTAFLAAGSAVLLGVCARLAAALSALQIGLFVPLVWLPIVFGGNATASQWGELVVGSAVTAGAWVVADSYRDTPWLAARTRRHHLSPAQNPLTS